MRIHRFLLPLAIVFFAIGMPATAGAQVYVSLVAPPPLLQYQQPQLSNPNYIWTPGYWAMGQSGYYWVQGSWQQPPQMGLLYTPGYWGYNQNQNQYNYNQGYWGQQVGYYGGINYGYGYSGNGYYGGAWQGNMFRYNTAVSMVDPYVIRNVYVDRTVIVRNVTHVSYNGGVGGIVARPDAREVAYANQRHYPNTYTQQQHVDNAARDRSNLESVNHGKPAVTHSTTAVARPETATASHVAKPQNAARPPAAGKPQGDAKPQSGTKPPA
jgi:hypothetical protein